jgi:hypothetical protein
VAAINVLQYQLPINPPVTARINQSSNQTIAVTSSHICHAIKQSVKQSINQGYSQLSRASSIHQAYQGDGGGLFNNCIVWGLCFTSNECVCFQQPCFQQSCFHLSVCVCLAWP